MNNEHLIPHILCALSSSHNGTMKSQTLYERIEPLVITNLRERDIQPYPSGQIRWHVQISKLKHELVGRGLIDKHCRRGTWSITSCGADVAGQWLNALDYHTSPQTQ